MCVVFVENCGVIWIVMVIELIICVGWVNRVEEFIEKFVVGDFVVVKMDFDGFIMV